MKTDLEVMRELREIQKRYDAIRARPIGANWRELFFKEKELFFTKQALQWVLEVKNTEAPSEFDDNIAAIMDELRRVE